jgi:hypothetical protein
MTKSYLNTLEKKKIDNYALIILKKIDTEMKKNNREQNSNKFLRKNIFVEFVQFLSMPLIET